AKIQAAVNDHAGDPVQAGCIAQELVFLEPGGVGEVVSADADEGELAVRRLVDIGVRLAVRFKRDDRILPPEPFRQARARSALSFPSSSRAYPPTTSSSSTSARNRCHSSGKNLAAPR